MEEAYKITGISSGQISDCCKGNCKTAGGYAWAYNNGNVNIEEVIKRATIPNRTNAVVIFQKDKNGNIIKEWQSITEAAHSLGVSHQGIQACCVSGVNEILYIVFIENIDTVYSNIFTKKHRFPSG